MKTRILLFLCLFSVITANAQTDSLTITNVVESDAATTIPAITKKRYNLYYAHHSFCVALPVAAAGFALMPADKYIADGVQKKLPGFEAKFDDYLQYAPWAAHFVMGACGVLLQATLWQLPQA